MLTTRAGLCLHDPHTLAPLAQERYSEPVDATLLVSARWGKQGSQLYTLPSEKSGHSAGGVYVFRRGVVGDIRLKRAPAESGGIVRIDVHPSAGVVVGIGSRGSAYILQEPIISSWPGPMYPPGAQGGGRLRCAPPAPL